jgi:hypothetical protein
MKNPSPNPDPTIPVSLDYFFELRDDGNQPEQGEAQVIIIPPLQPPKDGSTPPSNQPKLPPQT